MKRKKLVLSCLLALGVSSAGFALTGCDFEGLKDVTLGGHVHSYKASIILPNCQEMGYTIYTCACGATYQSDYVNKLDHRVVIDEAVPASCVREGLTVGAHCGVCGITIIAQKPVKPNDFNVSMSIK